MLISRAILPPKTYEIQITSSKYTSSTPTSIILKFIGVFELWRRGWDSNPRYGFPYARFRGEYFQPLSHLSAVVADLIVAERYVFRQSGSRRLVNGMSITRLCLRNGDERRAHRESREECAAKARVTRGV